MQNAPDVDPILSTGAQNLRRKKLVKVPWNHSGKHPGNALFWRIILLLLGIAIRYIFRNRQFDKTPKFDGGRVISAIHLNGLVDPLIMISSQDRRVITMGRHDLMTMPLIGWFSRRMGSQPVIRRPEISSGISDYEFAKKINDRTLLTMTNCISSGHNAVVMPEGKSHQDPHLHRLKTGPMRFALNAAAIAEHRGKPLPALQPLGLHYRCHYWFRTDVFVEFPEPISVLAPDVTGLGGKLTSGVWEEPPSDLVNSLRDDLFKSLTEVSPAAPDWETHRAWHLIGHIRANERGTALRTFREEVLAAREVRKALSEKENAGELLGPSIEASNILHSNNLDGRAISGTELKSGRAWGKATIGTILMTIMSPLSIVSTGPQAFAAWYFGDRTDEGIDARTTYHMLAAFFSPILFWPPVAFGLSLLIQLPSLSSIPIVFAIMASFHLSNTVFLFGYDLLTDFIYSSRTVKLADSEEGNRLKILLSDIRSNLNLL